MTIKHKALTLALSLGISACSFADTGKPITSNLFSEKPMPAEVTGKSCEVAKKYVDITNAGNYDQLGSLFSKDAVFMTPTGITLYGSEDIGAFYGSKINDLKPDLVAISYISDGPSCVMELVAATTLDNYAEFRLSAIDHFKVNAEGLIEHLIVYLRPGNPTTPVGD